MGYLWGERKHLRVWRFLLVFEDTIATYCVIGGRRSLECKRAALRVFAAASRAHGSPRPCSSSPTTFAFSGQLLFPAAPLSAAPISSAGKWSILGGEGRVRRSSHLIPYLPPNIFPHPAPSSLMAFFQLLGGFHLFESFRMVGFLESRVGPNFEFEFMTRSWVVVLNGILIFCGGVWKMADEFSVGEKVGGIKMNFKFCRTSVNFQKN